MSRQIVLDTETTGLSAEAGDRIIEIGCVELVARKLTGNNLHLYVNPERDSHEDALKVHGISNDFLRDKPKFAQIADELVDYLRGAELIIHNAAFDVGFIDTELQRLGRTGVDSFADCVTDTLAMAKERYPGKRNSLDALCDRLGVDNSKRTLHGALLDAELLADVYINLTRGQETLLIDLQGGSTTDNPVQRINLADFELPVIHATAEELAAHEQVLGQIDKTSGGKTIWRSASM